MTHGGRDPELRWYLRIVAAGGGGGGGEGDLRKARSSRGMAEVASLADACASSGDLLSGWAYDSDRRS